MDESNKSLLETICQINRLKKCFTSYREIFEYFREGSEDVTNYFNSFGYTLRLTNLEDNNFPENTDLSLMERFLSECKLCKPEQGSIVAFRVNLKTHSRTQIEEVIGPENELVYTGIYTPNKILDPMIYKPDIGQTPKIVTVGLLLFGRQDLKEEYYSLPK